MATLDSTVDWLHLFGDPTRVRLMALVAHAELTVADLTQITELAQPRISTHIGRLREAGLLRDRKVGACTYYALNTETMAKEAQAFWNLLSAEVKDAVLDSDAQRCQGLLRAREKQADWPDAVAGQMERHYSPGRTWEATARALLGFTQFGDVLDGGAGDGAITQLLAPRARSVTLLDRSERLVDAARKRLGRERNVSFCVGDLQALTFADESFDEVLLFNVLTNLPHPESAVAEAGRVLRRGGRIVVISLAEHAHVDITAAYQHLNQGFTPDQLRKMLKRARLEVDVCQVSSREKRQPYFQTVHAFARKP
jgi:SAM-dependent methyltransferase